MINPIAEYREWYSRKFKKSGGSKFDQEPGFPLEIPIKDGSNQKHRLNDGEYPSESMFKKLLHSLLFKLNKEDRAKDNTENLNHNGLVMGGHVTLATDVEAKDLDNGDESMESRVPRVSQLPTVEELPSISINPDYFQVTDSPTNVLDIDVDPSTLIRSNYQGKITDEFMNWLLDTFNFIKAYNDASKTIQVNITRDATTVDEGTILNQSDVTTGGTMQTLNINLEEVNFVNGNVSYGNSTSYTKVERVSDNTFRIDLYLEITP